MALIQVRDVPEDVYETIRRRARRAGQSIQAYMLSRIIAMEGRPTPSEVTEQIEAHLASIPPIAVDTDQILSDRDSGRP